MDRAFFESTDEQRAPSPAPGLLVHEGVPFALGDYLASGTAQAPRRSYEDALWAYIQANGIEWSTLEQLKRAGAVVEDAFPYLPGTLRGKVLTVQGEAADVAASKSSPSSWAAVERKVGDLNEETPLSSYEARAPGAVGCGAYGRWDHLRLFHRRDGRSA